jgi:hypothetical protein
MSSGIAEGNGGDHGPIEGEGSSTLLPAQSSAGADQKHTCEDSQQSSKKQLAESAESEDECITIPNHSATIEDCNYSMVEMDGLPVRLRLVSGIRRGDGKLVGECYRCDSLPMEISKLRKEPTERGNIEFYHSRFNRLLNDYHRCFRSAAEALHERNVIEQWRGRMCLDCQIETRISKQAKAARAQRRWELVRVFVKRRTIIIFWTKCAAERLGAAYFDEDGNPVLVGRDAKRQRTEFDCMTVPGS